MPTPPRRCSTRGGDLNQAVLDAIEAGRDFHTDKAVQRLALERMLANQGHGIADAARQRALQQKRAALVEYADVVLDEWDAALEPHTAALTAAAAALPVTNLANVQSVITRGIDAVQHWTNAKRSITMWTAAMQGFTAFADAAHVDHSEHKAQILTDADATTLEPARQTARLEGTAHVDAWILARRGVPLSLATINEFHARPQHSTMNGNPQMSTTSSANGASPSSDDARGHLQPRGRRERSSRSAHATAAGTAATERTRT